MLARWRYDAPWTIRRAQREREGGREGESENMHAYICNTHLYMKKNVYYAFIHEHTHTHTLYVDQSSMVREKAN